MENVAPHKSNETKLEKDKNVVARCESSLNEMKKISCHLLL